MKPLAILLMIIAIGSAAMIIAGMYYFSCRIAEGLSYFRVSEEDDGHE